MKEPLTIKQACDLVKCSQTTLYRLRKTNPHGEIFPKPYKVKSTSNRGPYAVNRWEHAEVVEWLRQGNGLDSKMRETHDKDTNPRHKNRKLVITAVSGGLLAGIAVSFFGE
jgi:predicted DNA-binding transcriptional regulator AlpA